MSKVHPIIAVTGSSGAGTSSVKTAFDHIFHHCGIKPMLVEGDGFHRYPRKEMAQLTSQTDNQNGHFSLFGIEANLLQNLEHLFKTYGKAGHGTIRHYIHDQQQADTFNQYPGTFTPWQEEGHDSDLLFYEGLHGALINDDINIAQYVDLKIGVVPVINLEWIQKIHRDTQERGYNKEEVKMSILRRMSDYVNIITPQFSRTDINFQRIPMVDTSNPFASRTIPTPEESLVVIHFRNPEKFEVDYPYLLSMLDGAFMSCPNTLVVKGGKMDLAIKLIFKPLILKLISDKDK